MIAKKHVVAVAVGACLLGLPSLSSQKNPVERPLKARIDLSVVLFLNADNVPVYAETSAWGQATHVGLCTSHAEGPPNLLEGVMTAANGDQIFWVAYDQVEVHITGGTGRFEGAAGSWISIYPTELVFVPGPDPGTLVAEGPVLLEGTITY